MTKSIIVSATVAACALVLGAAPAAVLAQTAPSKTDAAAGKRVFMRCMACHAVKAGAPNKVGPNLVGIVGAKAGQVKGFRYSPAMSKSTVKWDEATLDKWLLRPASVVPGTSMAFAGLSKPEDRKAVIAYLKKPTP